MIGFGLDPTQDLPLFEGRPRCYYMICSTPRCGSSLLGNLLTGTGAAGKPLEYYNPFVFVPLLRERFGSEDLGKLTVELFRRRTSANGVFGFKAHFDQFQFATEQLDPREIFPGLRFILITRKDLLRQAISYCRARESGIWSSREGAAMQVSLSLKKIENAMNDICRKQAGWRKYFALTGAEPIEVTYEELLGEPQGNIERIAAHLGVAPISVAPIGKAYHAPQKDEITEYWVERVRRQRIRGIAGICPSNQPPPTE